MLYSIFSISISQEEQIQDFLHLLCIRSLRERINGWVEESGMLGDIQGGFRKGRKTEDNLFMLERMIEMAKVRKECLMVAFIDMEKAYDRVNRKKLFEVEF